ncbi:MAG: Holliday junction resolvase RuvX [Clostridiales bacterium]|nr:MAG: Holliday junction resolvase RuvX [Clostridiales bacterium]
MRTLSLDVGDKTIGIAVTDLLNITAQGLETYYRTTVKADVKHIEALCRDLTVTTIVYGNPLHMNGDVSQQSQKVFSFIKQLQKKIQYGTAIDWQIDFCPIDERLTSMQAEGIMKMADLSRKERAKHVDKIAAQLILEQYLATR